MPAGVYLHIPFCKSRCSYCDFATDVYRSDAVVDAYVDALCREIAIGPPKGNPSRQTTSAGNPGGGTPNGGAPNIDTIYFGGGTPSLLASHQVERLLSAFYNKFDVQAGAEVTMEMNPATVSCEGLGRFRELGINRASVGV